MRLDYPHSERPESCHVFLKLNKKDLTGEGGYSAEGYTLQPYFLTLGHRSTADTTVPSSGDSILTAVTLVAYGVMIFRLA